jgi:iron(III) transport system substrate-binding protein
MTWNLCLRRRSALALAAVSITTTIASLLCAPLAQAQAPGGDLAALVAAAKTEGEVTLYSAATENVAARIAKEFGAKYGIKVQFLRLSSTALLQRYATEAESGKIVADLLLSGGSSVPFATQGIAKGWMEPINGAGLPAITSGEYPKAFNRDVSAIAQIQLWELAYNTDKVKAADAPKDWADIVNPKYKGEFILPDPAGSDAYLEFWLLLQKKFGNGFFEKLRALNPRGFPSGVPAMQSLAAGEGEIQVMLTNRAKAKSPNAARLLANWLLTAEGNKILNAEIGNVSVYDSSAFPAEYVSPAPDAASHKEEIRKLLGF